MSTRKAPLSLSDPTVSLPEPCDLVEFEGSHVLAPDGRMVRKRTISFGKLGWSERTSYPLSLRRTVRAELESATNLALAAAITIRILPIIDDLEGFEAKILSDMHQALPAPRASMRADFYIYLLVTKRDLRLPFVACAVNDGKGRLQIRRWQSGDPASFDRTLVISALHPRRLARAPWRGELSGAAARHDGAAGELIDAVVERLSEIAEQLS
jgi:hypothetical protein